MQEMTYGIPQRIPSLVSLSTIAMATDFQYECPSGMFSLLCGTDIGSLFDCLVDCLFGRMFGYTFSCFF